MVMPAFSWNSYTAPTQQFYANPVGAAQNYGFITPSDTKLATGANLTGFLTANGVGTPDQVTNRTGKYDGGLTREALYNSTGFLDNQLNTGFGALSKGLGDLSTTFDQYTQYGGAFGDKNSPVYSPQSKNGYSPTWGMGGNPFVRNTF